MYCASKTPGDENLKINQLVGDAKPEIHRFMGLDTSLDEADYDEPYLPGYSVILTFKIENHSNEGNDSETVKSAVIAIDWEGLGSVIQQVAKELADTHSYKDAFCLVNLINVEFLPHTTKCSPMMARYIIAKVKSGLGG